MLGRTKTIGFNIRKYRASLQYSWLDGNYHGESGKTLTSTVRLIDLLKETVRLTKGETRMAFGKRLWIYAKDGSCYYFDFIISRRWDW